jgi:hypothetical protein
MVYASQITNESEVLIDELLGHINATAAAIADVERKAGNDVKDIHYLLEVPAKQSPNIGLVLDINDNNGYRVLTVSPGGLAASFDIIQGDLITAINEVKVTKISKRLAFAELENLVPGDTIKLELNRDGNYSTITTKVEGQYTPSIKIELGEGKALSALQTDSSVNDNTELASESSACGTVSVFFNPPETKRLYRGTIARIGDVNFANVMSSVKLAPGKHTIYVNEEIDYRLFMQHQRRTRKPKGIEIDVKENTSYYLAAQFLKENRNKQSTGEYWEPVVWKVSEDKPCEL